jgi:hypothetical protein
MANPSASKITAFSPQGLSDEARRAVNAAFDAMSEWRNEVSASSDRYTGKVMDKMSEAARIMGWPDALISATKTHLQQTSRMQTQMIDQFMDAWQQQLKSPGSPVQLPTFPGLQLPGMPNMQMPGMPGMGQLGSMPMAPLQMWLQFADMWQKSFSQAMSTWMDIQKGNSPFDPRR